MSAWAGEGRSPTAIAKLLRRDLSSVARRLRRMEGGVVDPAQGRPRCLRPEDVDRLVAVAKQMIEGADCEYQVTARMRKAALKLKCTERTILNALHEKGVWFHSFREKPLLTDEDVSDRLQFARTHAPKPLVFWARSIDACLDEKHFTPYLTPTARAHARKARARGAFRAKKGGLGKGHVKPKKTMQHNLGRKVCVAVAISSHKVLACYVTKGNWSGSAAHDFYSAHLGPALCQAHARKRSFRIMEDNDPPGHKSGLGQAAKEAARISCFRFPKHSPDLMPLDYGFWTHINERLRTQEKAFRSDYWETRRHVVACLRRTILRTRPAFLRKLIGSMRRRCELLKAAKGWHFEEGA